MVTYSYLITSIIIILLPGPGTIYTVSTAINHSKRKGITAALGSTFGIIPHLILGIIALYMMRQLPANTMTFIKSVGALYLVYLGIRMLTDSGKIDLSGKSKAKSGLKHLTEGILLNLLNPKLTLFFISFLPQYILTEKGNYIFQALFLGLIFMVLTLLVFFSYGLLANQLGKTLLTSPNRLLWMNRVFGLLFILFAVRLYV